jgi:hypothetical protein
MNSNTRPSGGISRNLGAIVLIAIGLFFLATNVFGIRFNFWGAFWPAFVIVPGLLLLAGAVTGGKNAVGLVFPGAVVTMTGLILAVQNWTGHWESWSYTWALYPVAVGLALMYQGSRLGNSNDERNGRQVATSGIIMFLAFGAFFELIIFGGNSALGNIAIPVLLIGVGAYLLFFRRERSAVATYEKPKFTNPADVDPSLRRKIDAAIAEEEPEKPKV